MIVVCFLPGTRYAMAIPTDENVSAVRKVTQIMCFYVNILGSGYSVG